jgi:hypothetical protein
MSLAVEVLLQEVLLIYGRHSTLAHRDIAIQQIFCTHTTFIYTSMRYLADAVVWYQYGVGGTATEMVGGEWLPLQVGRFTPGEKALWYPSIGRGFGPRVGVGGVVSRSYEMRYCVFGQVVPDT